MNFTYQAVGDNTFVGNYFSDSMSRPYQYVIKLVAKEAPELGDTYYLDFTESNTGMSYRLSQGQVMESMSKHNDFGAMIVELIPEHLLKFEDQQLYEDFLAINIAYFKEQMERWKVDYSKTFNIMELDVKLAFVELSKNIIEDMIAENYKKMKRARQ
ncbi:hypothetical protein LKM01_27055 [Bacillus pacificus]|uniref:hypothetical protein n=1 Tax=Bacillus cereus group TaxID=86661 RepID=UPI000935B149|nr:MULTISPECIES: hypothetical protein [Bacillus cereus group]ASI80155.1 hypothetical protein BA202_23805 [Bacillus cereus]MCC2485438.1 hypothetical protein [Bacillus pacificus]MDA1608241.1 hypothetical protein [Bacillus cereus group sp. TH208-1LC]MED1646998.1 hypothetical protein [Bacillus pacificus]HDR7484889.1 hypothetical protein [Bacillus pacificus]